MSCRARPKKTNSVVIVFISKEVKILLVFHITGCAAKMPYTLRLEPGAKSWGQREGSSKKEVEQEQ